MSDAAPARADNGGTPPDDATELRRLVEMQRDLGRAAAGEANAAARRLEAAEAELRRLQSERRRHSFRALTRRAIDQVRRLSRSTERRTRQALIDFGARAKELAPDRPSRRERAIAAALAAEAEMPSRATGPLVSVIMLNRNGAALLRRYLPALARTAYRPIELIVVDNGSDDESVSVIDKFSPDFPVRLIRNSENRSFSDANNQGVEASHGEVILFLNNDVEPAGPHWLGAMVEAVGADGVGAVGARLVYPANTPGPRAGRVHADLTVQHAGVWFPAIDGMPLGAPIGVGGDPTGPVARASREVPALTAACLLVRALALRDVGGYTPGYDYGQEDVDFCLKLQVAGWRLVYVANAVLWHHESATRQRSDRATRKARIRSNRERFVSRWGPPLFRTVMRSAIAGDGSWREPLHVGVVGATAESAVPLPRDRGWRVDHCAGDCVSTPGDTPDILVSGDPAYDVRSLPPGVVRAAWVEDALAWSGAATLTDYDLVFARAAADVDALESLHGLRPALVTDPAALVDALAGWVDARRVTVRAGIPAWSTAQAWGDLHFARDLGLALRRLGVPTRIDILPDWHQAASARDDISIHLYGLSEAPTHPGQVNVLWQISHPDRATPELYDRYDLAFVASRPFAAWMRGRTKTPVLTLHQATSPIRFAPRPGGPPHELLFVANSRGVRRHILDDLLPTDHDLAVYGRGWTAELIDPALVAGDHVPNEELAAYYAAAAIVLNDHWSDMQREGFISNRIYDASAAGAFVITDAVEGLREEFDGGVVAYRGRQELADLVDACLLDPAARAAMAGRAKAAVIERHTFDHRAREILAAVDVHVPARRMAIVP